jgi:probable HAF family extracellular repeat protein
MEDRMLKFTARPVMILMICVTAVVSAPAQFHIVAIGSGYTSANGVNDKGQFVGTQSNFGSPPLGFAITTGDGLLIVPVSVMLTQVGATVVTANGINNLGAIVGNYTDIFGSHGFLQSNAATFPIAIDFPGASQTVATGVNDLGQIVGYYITGSTFNGFEDVGGTLTALAPPGATFTQIFGINNAGQISGTYGGGDCSGICGFVYRAGTFTQIQAPGAISTNVYGISNAGVVVGQYTTNSETHGFAYSGGVFTNVDAPECDEGTTIVMGANRSGELVGNCTKTVPNTFGGAITMGFIVKLH